MIRRTPQHGLDKIIEWEGGYRLVPYQDTKGVWTDGVGNTHGVVPHGPAISKEKAEQQFRDNIYGAEVAVDSHVKVPLTDNQFAVLVSFVFNEGIEAFITSTLLKVLNNKNYNLVPGQLRRWDKEREGDKFVIVKGLINRREKEIALWNESI